MDWELTSEQVHHMALSLAEAEATFTDAVEWAARAQARKLAEWILAPCNNPSHGHLSPVQRRACVDCCLCLKAAVEVK